VGLGTTALLIGIKLPSAYAPLQLILFTIGSALPLGLAGGYFGSQLFPPIARARRKRRLEHAL
jgi:hypothetical protein